MTIIYKTKLTPEEQRLKETLTDFFNEKKVKPPISSNKLIKAGYDPTAFLLELEDRLKPFSHLPIIQDYLNACKRLL